MPERARPRSPHAPARRLRRTAPHLDRLSAPFAAVLGARDRWTVAAAHDTTPVAWPPGRRQTDARAIVAALCLAPLEAPAPGVHAAHRLVTLEDLRDGLVRAGMTVGMAVG